MNFTDVRVRFNKTGRIKFISHLDIYRTVIRAIRRTDIPVWYTEGFNPHVYLNFLLPVPLGCESYSDAFDMRLTEFYDFTKIPSEINKYLPEGIECTYAGLVYDKAKEINSAEWYVRFDGITPEELDRLMKMPLVTEKLGKVKGKKTMKQVDVSANIREYHIMTEEAYTVLTFIGAAGNTVNINPFELSEALSNVAGYEITPTLAKRIGIYTPGGKFN